MKKTVFCLTALLSSMLLISLTGCMDSDANDTHEHDYKATVTEPTCTTQGFTTYACACGDSYVQDYVEGGHKPAEAVRENEVEATCVTDGSCNEVVYCLVCSEKLSETEKTTKALGHEFGEYLSDENETCIKDGTKSATCSRCTEKDTITNVGSKKGHTLVDGACLNCDYTEKTGTKGLRYELTADGTGYVVTGYDGTDEDLTNLVIPEKYNGKYVDSIGRESFSGKDLIENIIIAEGVGEIDFQAFYGCFNLTTIVIPSTVSNIGDFAFRFCSNLEKIYYGGTAEDYASIEVGEDNFVLDDAVVYYYSKEKPASGVKAWHYVNDLPVMW